MWWHLPISIDMGLLVHQPRSVTNGIQKSRNWMLTSGKTYFANLR